ncbi:MAG: four helix bundle protein [Bacteroidota bacterium]|nr:four helix bundle protein [Bacteroidota bacterium]
MKDFKKLQIWQKGIAIVKLCYKISEQLPTTERFNLISQINRAAVSIPSNIAEGSSRRSERDYFRFLEIALGSCFELETQLIILDELGLASSEKINELLAEIRQEQQMISSFSQKLQL